MSSFPEARIVADRLDIREFGSGDARLVGELLGAGEPEALPPGAPAAPDRLPGWLADGAHQLRRGGGGVHLMMLDRARAKIVGAISVFHAEGFTGRAPSAARPRIQASCTTRRSSRCWTTRSSLG